jgi:hypothetical protein
MLLWLGPFELLLLRLAALLSAVAATRLETMMLSSSFQYTHPP